MTTLVLEFKKIELDDKIKYAQFIQTQKQKQLLIKVTLMMYLNQSILQSILYYKNTKISREKVQAGLLIQS